MYCGSEKNYKYFFHLIEIWTLRKGAWFNFILTTLGGGHSLESATAVNLISLTNETLLVFYVKPVIYRYLKVEYTSSIVFYFQWDRLELIPYIVYVTSTNVLFLPQSPVIHVAYRVRCKGGHLRIKLSKRSPWFWHAGWIMCIFYIQFVINTNLWSKIQRCCNIC